MCIVHWLVLVSHQLSVWYFYFLLHCIELYILVLKFGTTGQHTKALLIVYVFFYFWMLIEDDKIKKVSS